MNIFDFLIASKICEIIVSTGNSIKGPIINAKAINGCSGRAVTTIANAIGEFLCDNS
ncbi:hypothetical protein MTP04_18020 [Lysinibacillus sp. PLM2]|nr:hypothetical protein MTP04_18020 [Lysinibacillus sp. PLM2]